MTQVPAPLTPRPIQGLETDPVRPPVGQPAGSAGQPVSDAIHNRVALAIHRTGVSVEFAGAFADKLLADTEILDALLAYAIAHGEAGIAVGYIVRRADGEDEDPPVDEDGGRVVDVYRYDHHTTIAEARRGLAEARADMPEDDWRLYALTEITERPTE